MRLAWLLASVVLLAFPIARWASIPASERFAPVKTPLDRTTPWSAPQFRFLREATGFVPPGAAFTVLAPDGRTEMNLFMMSIGVLPDRLALPASYFLVPIPESMKRAEYFLAFRCAAVPGGLVPVAQVPDGCIFRTGRRR